MIHTLGRDLRYAFRQIGRGSAIAALVVGTLAIGIGANTALFTMANAIFTRPLPGIRESERLVWVTPRSVLGGYPTALSYPDYQDYRRLSGVFQDVAVFGNLRLAVRAGAEPEEVRGQIVSANYFNVLGVRMALGRAFQAEDDSVVGASPLTVLSHRYWTDRFGADSAIVGKHVTVNGMSFNVVGVAEQYFNGPSHAEQLALWVPMSMIDRAWPLNPKARTSRGVWWLESIGRLRPGVSLDEASSAAATVAARIAKADTATHGGITARVQAMRSGLRPGDMNDIYPVATLATMVTLLVLLIACANVSNVLLSRALARRREIAVRLSIGASRGRVVRQLLTESAVLAVLATLLGTLVAMWATDLVASLIPAPLGIAVDQRVLAFAALAAVGTTVLFGLVPALHATRGDVASALRTAGTGHDPRRSRLQSGFVIAQVALSLVLLATAGLFLSSLHEATRVDVGFDASRRVLAMSFDLGMQGYTPQQTEIFLRQLEERARALPGVQEVAVTQTVPLGDRNVIATPWLEAKGKSGSVRREERRDIETYLHTVTPGYFKTIDLPLRRGRGFAATDAPGSPGVAVVSAEFARVAWGKADPIGQRVATSERGDPLTVVGVVKDAMLAGTTERARAALYIALRQNPRTLDLAVLVRSRGDAASLAAPMRAVFQALDATMPITGVQTLAQYRWDSLSENRLGSRLLSIFGAIALLLASVGVYAVIAFSVAQRTREIGVRVALGALHRQVVALFIRQGLRLTAYGLIIGLALAVAMTKLMSVFFLGISATDVLALGAVSTLLLLVSLLAAWVPARRAARVDPMLALRAD